MVVWSHVDGVGLFLAAERGRLAISVNFLILVSGCEAIALRAMLNACPQFLSMNFHGFRKLERVDFRALHTVGHYFQWYSNVCPFPGITFESLKVVKGYFGVYVALIAVSFHPCTRGYTVSCTHCAAPEWGLSTLHLTPYFYYKWVHVHLTFVHAL